MIDWLIKHRVVVINALPRRLVEWLEKAVTEADSLGYLFLGVVEIEDAQTNKEYVLMKKEDFESWYGNG